MNVLHRLLITVVIALGLWGCASLAPVEEEQAAVEQVATEPGSLPEGEGWWYARFHIDWPEGEATRWYMGTLIGGEVIAPIFDDYYQDVYIWRVHRRASRDGHVVRSEDGTRLAKATANYSSCLLNFIADNEQSEFSEKMQDSIDHHFLLLNSPY